MLNRYLFFPLAILLVGFVGCGGDGLDRVDITGSVSFRGAPVKSGAIFFEPTASVGAIAPTVYLPIRDGKFDTAGEGPIRGLYNVTVGGYDNDKSRVDNDGITHTEQLFPDYKFQLEIPPKENPMNIVVPEGKSGAAVKSR
jgi:hypothetical protein